MFRLLKWFFDYKYSIMKVPDGSFEIIRKSWLGLRCKSILILIPLPNSSKMTAIALVGEGVSINSIPLLARNESRLILPGDVISCPGAIFRRTQNGVEQL